MLVDLSDMLNSEGMQAVKEIPLEMTSFESRMGSFAIVSKTPASFTFTGEGKGRVEVAGKARLVFQALCDRCLTEVPVEMELLFSRAAVLAEPEDGESDEFWLEDGKLDVEALIHNEILMNWPAKILCREDCKGICPVCGRNRNEGDCGCDTFVPDPRMAVIQDIFNKNKEV